MKVVANKDEGVTHIYPFVNRNGDSSIVAEQIIVREDGKIWVIMHSNVMSWQDAQLWGHALLCAKTIARDGPKERVK